MDFFDAYHLWADAHAFFDSTLIPSPSDHTDPLATQTAGWERRLAEETPNGHLLRQNALFEALSGSGKLHLLHVTHALEEISRQGVLYPSGGCLVGSIYCAPLTATGQGFRMHNLGAYVLTREAPTFLAKLGVTDRVPAPLIFEIDTPPQAYRGLAGVDYLRLGLIHLQIYSHLEYLLSKNERHQLRETVVSRVKNSAAFLAAAAAVAYHGTRVGADPFLKLLDETIPRLPILGYLYFEAVAEYLMLHSASRHTRRLAELGRVSKVPSARRRLARTLAALSGSPRYNQYRGDPPPCDRTHQTPPGLPFGQTTLLSKHALGELNNWLYKEMLFASFPAMAGKFDLARFRPRPKQLAALIHRVDPTIDTSHASAYLVERISYLVAVRLFAPGDAPEAWHHTRWEFDSLATQLGPLLGHLIHRELRTFGRYPDFYFYFDQHKALQAWNYWNHMDIVAPFNGTMPKGEIGINPAYPNLDYRVWRAEQDDAGHLHPAEELALTIAPRLVDIKYTLMRNNQWTAPAPSAA